jgi:hypothetical protein
MLAAGLFAVADDNPAASFDAKRLKSELPSTWENAARQDLPKELQFIKHITPTHFTWLVYGRDKDAILSITGGVWSLKDGHYEESIEYASDDVQQLRGKTFPFTIKLVEDRWDHKSLPDGELDVEEVWTRLKRGNQQEKNTGEPGRHLLGTWEKVIEPGTPKAIRMVKHVTPTHWTWALYDRENRRVLAACGGTWSLRDGEYVEDCEFSTDNFPQPRGKSNAFEFRIEGDRWILKGGGKRVIRDDETWTRLSRPNP